MESSVTTGHQRAVKKDGRRRRKGYRSYGTSLPVRERTVVLVKRNCETHDFQTTRLRQPEPQRILTMYKEQPQPGEISTRE
jgi:hypothetical protein